MEKKYYENQFSGVHGDDCFTPVCRSAFLNLVEPNRKFSPYKYGLTLLAPKDEPKAKEQLKAIQTMCLEMATQLAATLYAKEKGKKPAFEEFKKNFFAGFAAQPIFRDGDSSAYQGFPGHWVIVAKNEKKSGFTILDDRMPEEFEAGQLVRAQIQPYVDSKGFSYKLRGLRLIKDDGVRYNIAPDGASLLRGLDDAVEASKVGQGNSVGPSADDFKDNNTSLEEAANEALGGASEKGADLNIL